MKFMVHVVVYSDPPKSVKTKSIKRYQSVKTTNKKIKLTKNKMKKNSLYQRRIKKNREIKKV